MQVRQRKKRRNRSLCYGAEVIPCALNQFVAALVILPPLMTFAEAFAPHSMDTPLMILSGYTVLAGICCWNWF